jgi:hypothetical protein
MLTIILSLAPVVAQLISANLSLLLLVLVGLTLSTYLLLSVVVEMMCMNQGPWETCELGREVIRKEASEWQE